MRGEMLAVGTCRGAVYVLHLKRNRFRVWRAGTHAVRSLEIGRVLPRKGAEFNLAMNNVGSSRSLTQISSMDTSGRVEAQAVRGQLLVTPLRGVLSVDEQYPVVVTAAEDNYVLFDVVGDALGFVPVVISGLNTSALPTGHGLWTSSCSKIFCTENAIN